MGHRTTVDELRASSRFAKERDTDFAVIWHTEGEEMLVEVHDESLGGIALYLHDVKGFSIGQEVNVVYAGTLMNAYVRHIEPRPAGEFVIGLECERWQ